MFSPTQSKKETEPVNLLQENGSNQHQLTTGQSEKSGETIETERPPAVTTAEQKRGKPDRGLKRGMKGKQVDSAGVKAAEPKGSDKVDMVNEPSAKRTTRPSKNTTPVAPCMTKPAVNGKTQASANSGAAASSNNANDNRAQPQGKGQGSQTSQKDKGLDRKSKSNAEVSVISQCGTFHTKIKTL